MIALLNASTSTVNNALQLFFIPSVWVILSDIVGPTVLAEPGYDILLID
jgi:hypothetical protein